MQTYTRNIGSHWSRPESPRSFCQSAKTPTNHCEAKAPRVPIMFISPNRGPTCLPLCSIADDHHIGSVNWTKKHERAAKIDSPSTESALTAKKSVTALAKNAQEQNKRLLRTTLLEPRIILSEITPPSKTPTAAPNNARDVSNPDFVLPIPCADSR